MRFGAAFWVNRTTWPELRSACLAVEHAGWDSLWIDDHLLADEGDPTHGKLEGWTTLAALSVLTSRVRLGLLVAAEVAAFVDGYREIGVNEVIVVFRDPFDLESIERIREVRAALGG